MPKKKPEKVREYKVGDRILVNLHRGRIKEATITAIIERTSGKKIAGGFWEGYDRAN